MFMSLFVQLKSLIVDERWRQRLTEAVHKWTSMQSGARDALIDEEFRVQMNWAKKGKWW